MWRSERVIPIAVLLFMLVTMQSNARAHFDFSVEVPDPIRIASLEEFTVVKTIVSNNGDLPDTIDVSLEVTTPDTSWLVLLCVGPICYPPGVREAPLGLEAQESDSVTVDITAFNLHGSAHATLHFVSRGDTSLQETVRLAMITDGTDVLIVDGDGGSNYETYYRDAVPGTLTNGIWDLELEPVTAPELDIFGFTVWLTGERIPALVTEEMNELATLLDGGGKLFISGQDIGRDIALSDFYRDYLHAAFINDSSDIFVLDGIDGEPISDGLVVEISGGDGANNQVSPDEVVPIGGGAYASFLYSGTLAPRQTGTSSWSGFSNFSPVYGSESGMNRREWAPDFPTHSPFIRIIRIHSTPLRRSSSIFRRNRRSCSRCTICAEGSFGRSSTGHCRRAVTHWSGTGEMIAVGWSEAERISTVSRRTVRPSPGEWWRSNRIPIASRKTMARPSRRSGGRELTERGSDRMKFLTREETIVAVTILLMLALGFGWIGRLQAGEKKHRAAEFSLKDLNGHVIELNQLLGKGPVVINFWATWCKPCLKELPHLEKIQKDFRDQGVEVVAISEDSPLSVSKVKSFISGNRYTFTVLLDTNGKVMRKYGLLGTPYTLLLNPQGEILYKHFGYRPGDENTLRDEVGKALSGKEGGANVIGRAGEDLSSG
jgi:peroxiredoxin